MFSFSWTTPVLINVYLLLFSIYHKASDKDNSKVRKVVAIETNSKSLSYKIRIFRCKDVKSLFLKLMPHIYIGSHIFISKYHFLSQVKLTAAIKKQIHICPKYYNQNIES